MTSWTLVKARINKEMRGTHAMVSRQPKSIGTHKGREADDGTDPKRGGTGAQAERPC